MLGWLRLFARKGGAARGDARALLERGAAANAQGRHADAAELLLAALRADAGISEAHYELGRALRALGEPERAVTCFRAALARDASHRDAHIDIAAVMLSAGNVRGAEESARAALALDTASVPARVNLGAALQGQGRFAEAAACYRAALEREPASVPALVNLSAVALQAGDLGEAADAARRAREAAPQSVEALLQEGFVRLEQRRPAEAAHAFEEALRLRPGHAPALTGLGFASDIQGRLDEALARYEAAIAADPGFTQARVNRATILLLREDYASGWDAYESRLDNAETAPLHARFSSVPSWDGGALEGRRVLVYAEQGLGDEILFASCLPDVIARAAHCVIDCDARLAGLFRRSFPQATVHGGAQTEPADWLAQAGPVDLRVPIGSLPRAYRRRREDFPAHCGYLRADPSRVEAWRGRLSALGASRTVGLSWRAGVPQTGRGSRSLTLEELLPVLRAPGAAFVSLQYGPAGAEADAFARRHGVALHRWQDALDDYEETAALVAALDLVVATSTTVVDLAGALGRPAWTLVPVRTDFRYGLVGEAHRWYPSVRVFRQRAYGDWAPVVEAAAAALRA